MPKKIQRKREKRNLHRTPVYIKDDSERSDNFFVVRQLGDEFSLGKNGFLIEGSKSLKSDSDIEIEILDANSNPIYHEISSYQEASSYVVSVLVYPDVTPGQCTVTILGEAKEDLRKEEIPNEWKGKKNIMWQRGLSVNPDKFNSDPIRFYKKPSLLVSEQQYTEQEHKYIVENNQYSGDIFYRVGNSSVESYKEYSEYVSDADPYDIENERIEAVYYPQEYGYSHFIMTTYNEWDFTENMEGQFFVISSSRARVDYQEYLEAPPDKKEEIGQPPTLAEDTGIDENIDCRIIEVVSKDVAKFEIVSENWKNYPKKLNIGPTRHFNLVYKAKPNASESRAIHYYKNLEIGNIRTLTGECVRARVYNKRINYTQSYEFIGDYEIEPTELFIRPDDARAELIKPAGEFDLRKDYCTATGETSGECENIDLSATVDPYVSSDKNTNMFYDQKVLINSVGAEIKDTSESSELVFDIGVSNYTFFKDAEYNLSFEIAYKASEKADSSAEVTLSGAATFGREERLKRISLENEVYNSRKESINFFPLKTASASNPFKKVIDKIEPDNLSALGEIENINLLIYHIPGVGSISDLIDYIRNDLGIGPSSDLNAMHDLGIGNLRLHFHMKSKAERATWYIKNIYITPAQSMGFSPDYTVLKVPVDTDEYSYEDIKKLQYKVDLFDVNNNKAGVYLESD